MYLGCLFCFETHFEWQLFCYLWFLVFFFKLLYPPLSLFPGVLWLIPNHWVPCPEPSLLITLTYHCCVDTEGMTAIFNEVVQFCSFLFLRLYLCPTSPGSLCFVLFFPALFHVWRAGVAIQALGFNQWVKPHFLSYYLTFTLLIHFILSSQTLGFSRPLASIPLTNLHFCSIASTETFVFFLCTNVYFGFLFVNFTCYYILCIWSRKNE